jgi:hypothetical protein
MLGFILLALCGCSKLYTPTSVRISMTNDAIAGEWISLKASQVVSGTVQDDVQAQLFWFTDPTNVARFNVATLESVSRDALGRQVMFSRPGTYRIWAVAEPGSVTSNVETVTVRLKQ